MWSNSKLLWKQHFKPCFLQKTRRWNMEIWRWSRERVHRLLELQQLEWCRRAQVKVKPQLNLKAKVWAQRSQFLISHPHTNLLNPSLGNHYWTFCTCHSSRHQVQMFSSLGFVVAVTFSLCLHTDTAASRWSLHVPPPDQRIDYILQKLQAGLFQHCFSVSFLQLFYLLCCIWCWIHLLHRCWKHLPEEPKTLQQYNTSPETSSESQRKIVTWIFQKGYTSAKEQIFSSPLEAYEQAQAVRQLTLLRKSTLFV